MLREFGRKTLTYMSENKATAPLEAKIRKNSLYFPGYQGIWALETCSLQPPSTATHKYLI
jgi:hypothetical protein